MLAIGQSGLGAGRCYRRIDDLGMSLGRDLFLRNQNLIADRAMLTFGQSGCGASRCFCSVDNLGVTLGGNFFLRN